MLLELFIQTIDCSMFFLDRSEHLVMKTHTLLNTLALPLAYNSFFPFDSLLSSI